MKKQQRFLFGLREILVFGVLLATMGGCANKQGVPTTKAGQIQFVSNKEQISEVVQALEMGDTKRAGKILKALQKRDPGNSQFQTLHMSMNADPAAVLGPKSFAYIVKRGESMASLSTLYLGDPLKFFLLVRFNGLKDAQLTAGQTLRIPGNPPVAEPAPVTRNRPAPKPAIAAPRQAAVPSAPKPNAALASTLRGRGLAALNRGNINEAVAILRRAKAADPQNAAILRDLDRAERLSASVKARK